MLTDKDKILVVDDDPSVVDHITDVFSEFNYEAFGAFNGEAAIRIIQSEIPDLIIMDWEMPVKDGIETLKYLKKMQAIQHIPVIMISGRMTSMGDLQTAFDAGAIDFIRKPIDPVELIARTKSMLMLAKYFKESVQKKDWELTLLSKTNHQNNSLINELLDVVYEIKESCTSIDLKLSQKLEDKILKIKGNFRNKSWEQFETYFKNVHPFFSDNLLKEYPNITSEELRLCYFLRLNMTSKEIASITNKEMHSIDIARYRLRKKLHLDRHIKLHEFLSNF